MHSAIRLLVASVLSWTAAMPAAVAAPADCRHTSDIVAAADFLLTDPKDTRRWHDWLGTDAAYLMIRYGDLAYANGMRLIDELGRRSYRLAHFDGLRVTFTEPRRRIGLFSVHRDGWPPGGVSAMRAFILEGNSEIAFRNINGRIAAQDRDRTYGSRIQHELMLGLFDLGDETKKRIAAEAEAAGLWVLATELLATTADPRDWLAAIRRSPQAPSSQEQLTQLFAPIWLGHTTHVPRPFALDSLPTELKLVAEALDAQSFPARDGLDALRQLERVAPRTYPLAGLSYQYVIARGGLGTMRAANPLLAEVAIPLLNAIKAGNLDPAADDDRIRVAIFNGAVAVLGLDQVREFMSASRIRPEVEYNETTLSAFQRVVARHALTPFARGDSAPPHRPTLLSPDFDWMGWLNVADTIRRGGQVSERYRGTAAELLFAMGRYTDAINMLHAIGPTYEARQRAYTMMLALDQLCGRLIWPPHKDPVYRFDPR
jgi:hypothetical protein